jgi:Flp pilus assembly protein TadB
MAQTRRRRRKKHRGTQGGKLDARPRSRPRNRAEAKARAQSRSKRASGSRAGPRERGLTPPNWRSAFYKGAVAALLFFVLIGIAFKKPLAGAAALAAFMLLFYVPMSYYTDRFFYQRRIRQAEKERIAKSQRGGAGES